MISGTTCFTALGHCEPAAAASRPFTAKLRRALKATDFALGSVPTRLKGMHQRRYEQLVAKIRAADHEALRELHQQAARLCSNVLSARGAPKDVAWDR